MAEMKQIHEFAAKWCDKFRDQNINYIELVDHYMADDCAALVLRWTAATPSLKNMVMPPVTVTH